MGRVPGGHCLALERGTSTDEPLSGPAAWLSAIKSGPIALSPAIFPHTGPVFS
jgi:hypothetical protein